MTDLERLLETIKANHMAKQHEDWGYPRGWNGHAEFVEGEIEKLIQEDRTKPKSKTTTEHTN